jgi:hypothetical protein
VIHPKIGVKVKINMSRSEVVSIVGLIDLYEDIETKESFYGECYLGLN